ncbi:ATP-binding protein [Pseudomonas monsensis]|uniref:ATP-binding protein n=1 Tax=Pseudomonas monsensis TaxID=2745509 RepID=A0ABT3YP48_9PSED|nr:ATP-binding protein [Pseudomonas monsensis]MCY0107274.1 ATP-binding protein [Pseudomonas monsensis]
MTIDTGFHLKNYKSFGPTGAGIRSIKFVNVIIGRNNIGKSSLLLALDYLCRENKSDSTISSCVEITEKLNESKLKSVFRENYNDGPLGNNHWFDHGLNFVGADLTWKDLGSNKLEFVKLDQEASEAEISHISALPSSSALRNMSHIKLDADRDITPESITGDMFLSSSGAGATQVIHKYLHHVEFDRTFIQKNLLNALNQIFSPDITFNEVVTRFHSQTGKWEIYLGEESKGPIALSSSGSGLKTVILTLLNLLVRPNFENRSSSSYIFSLEELENNLHPALQRNLFVFLEDFAVGNGCHIFLTTHSNVAIDIFGSSPHAQILHVMRGADGIVGTVYSGEAEGHGVLDDLGVRASDLLQANGLIWVEGPSDRVFLKKWIEIWSNGSLTEGRHYQFVFYGGSVLANINTRLPEIETREAISAFQINRNFAFICDSDRKSPNGTLKPRVAQLIKDVAGSRGMVWVTRCTEVENYIPREAFEAAHSKVNLPQIGEYEKIQDYLQKNNISDATNYTNKHSKAFKYAEYFSRENLAFRPELEQQMAELVKKIKTWNS